jgi:hypothetical protein
MQMKNTALLLVITLYMGLQSIHCQTTSGRLTVKVKELKEYQGLWDSLIIQSKDTIIRMGRGKSSTQISLQQGRYQVILKSRLNNTLIKEVNIKKAASIEFNTLYYYSSYRDTVSMLNKMADGDTCFVSYTNGANNLPAMDYFMVVKEGSNYNIIIKNEIEMWRSLPVFEYEIDEFMRFGKYEGMVTTADNEGLGVYYWSLNRRMLRNSCGVCMFGFLLRKRLVRMP